MDELKDTANTKQSPIASTNRPVISGGGTHPIYVYLHKRTERLVAALFLITDILSEKNPIRHKIQSSAVEVLSFMLSTSDSFVKDTDRFAVEYATRLLEILSLVEVAHLAGHLSEMNFKLITAEFERVISMSDRLKKSASPERSHVSAVLREEKAGEREGVKLISSSYLISHAFKPRKSKGHDIGHYKRHTQDVNGGASPIGMHVSDFDRRGAILSMLQGGQRLTIKDFTVVIKGFSEKTIQRELSSMVRAGVLKKEGERRWSRYSAVLPAQEHSRVLP